MPFNVASSEQKYVAAYCAYRVGHQTASHRQLSRDTDYCMSPAKRDCMAQVADRCRQRLATVLENL